ncbi:hypothetical protein MD484_g8332, partial [Candolleomyces efflorescens]
MATHAAELGLRIKGFKHDEPTQVADADVRFKDSLSGAWHLFEILPLHRLTFANTTARIGGMTRIPHFWRARKIHEGQFIHCSVVEDRKYIPKARLKGHGSDFWTELRSDDAPDSITQLIHKDMFYNVVGAVKDLLTGNQADSEEQGDSGERMDSGDPSSELTEFVEQDTGKQLLYDEVMGHLLGKKGPEIGCDAKLMLLRTMLKVFADTSLQNIRLKKWSRIRASLGEVLGSSDSAQVNDTRRFLRQFSKEVNCLCELRQHQQWVNSVGISADGKRIASGASNGTIRVWDAEQREQLGQPMRGHAKAVYSVAFLPNGNVISGSLDATIRIWDAETGMEVGEPMRGHQGSVEDLVISSDGQYIVSASIDKTIRIWELETRKEVGVLRNSQGGSLHPVTSVAISMDGKRIVSGHQDGIIRIWDRERGEEVGPSLALDQEGDTKVNSVAISPDGKLIASGHKDHTIRIWDLETRGQLGDTLQGHTGKVFCVAFSHDSNHLVSASGDYTIRVWDVYEGTQVGEPLQGHGGSVNSVAVSPDGKSNPLIHGLMRGRYAVLTVVLLVGILSVTAIPTSAYVAIKKYAGGFLATMLVVCSNVLRGPMLDSTLLSINTDQ